MLFLTTYTVKPFLSKADQKKLLDLFAEQGTAPGTVAHYMAVDNSHGVTITEADDIGGSYAAALAYSEYIEFHSVPILTIEDALPHLLESVK